MKKKYLLLPLLAFSVAFISCSSSTITKVDKSKIAPPAWIQGTWVLKSAPTIFQFRFTSDDISYKISENTQEISVKGTIAFSKGSSFTTNTSTETIYKVTIKYKIPNTTQEITCTKVSATEITIEGGIVGQIKSTFVKKK